MSTENPVCAQFSAELPELALGVLTGRDRAAALAHVETCQRCADELEQLSRAADAVVRVAPEVEPPVGFETRLFDRMGVTDDAEVSVTRRRIRPPAWVFATAAAVVALGLGLGIGWSMGSPSAGHRSTQADKVTSPAIVTTAVLRHDGQSVGRVSTSGGSSAWMYMTLDGSSMQGQVKCQVVTDDGVIHTVGTFTVKHGYGAWGAPLPMPPRQVRSARVVSPKGTVLATATLG